MNTHSPAEAEDQDEDSGGSDLHLSEPDNPLGRPMPGGGWSESITELRDAYVVPPVESSFVQAAGLLAADGSYCPQGALWRKWRPLTTEPAMPEGELPVLKGKWLWGGVLWAHFGHFLAESTTRLWALDKLGEAEGILYIPKRPAVGEEVRGFQLDFIRQMGTDLPVKVASEPMRVEHLVVPGPGFGLGEIIAGTQSYRDAIHARYGSDIPAEGGPKIYISRSLLGVQRGGLVGEERLEELLTAEGYEIYHPQKFSMAEQVARYKAATHVIAAEGSALHLFAMVARPDQKVAVVLRRQSSASNYIEQHLASFGGSEPLPVQALRRIWMPEGTKAKRMGLGELDFPAVEKLLAEGGFVSGTAGWPDMRKVEVRRLLGKRAGNLRPMNQRKKVQGNAAED